MIAHDFYVTPGSFCKDLDIVINNVGYSQNSPGYNNGYHQRNSYILHYICSGTGTYKVNSKSYFLKKDDIFLVFPYTTVFYQASYSHPWCAYWEGFNGNKADYFVDRLGIKPEEPILLNRTNPEIMKCFENMSIEIQRETTNQERLLMFFYEIISLFTAPSSMLKVFDSSYINTAKRFVANHYNLPITVSDLADECNISTSQLYRCFKKELNISPHKYIETYKINKAVELISSTDLSFQDISYLLGYEYESHFFKVFKRVTSFPPSHFRCSANPKDQQR